MAFDELTDLYLNCHEAVREIIKMKTGEYPEDYKKYEKEKIDKFFRTIPWRDKNFKDFISNMMSELIVAHGLTNTNHRTTILFTSIILKEMNIAFPYYNSSIEKERWINDCNIFIEGSKTILHKRKTDPQFKEKHLKWTKEWLIEVTEDQSMSSGMMSVHLLTSLRKIPSSGDLFSSVIK